MDTFNTFADIMPNVMDKREKTNNEKNVHIIHTYMHEKQEFMLQYI